MSGKASYPPALPLGSTTPLYLRGDAMRATIIHPSRYIVPAIFLLVAFAAAITVAGGHAFAGAAPVSASFTAPSGGCAIPTFDPPVNYPAGGNTVGSASA